MKKNNLHADSNHALKILEYHLSVEQFGYRSSPDILLCLPFSCTWPGSKRKLCHHLSPPAQEKVNASKLIFCIVPLLEKN